MKRMVIASLVLAYVLGAVPIVRAQAVPSYCTSANPRVTLYESDSQTGDWVTLCTNISNLDLIDHVQTGDCARIQFDPDGNDWDNCANSIKVWLPAGDWCLRLYNFSDYSFPFKTFRGTRSGSNLDIDNDVLSSLRFFRDPTIPWDCV